MTGTCYSQLKNSQKKEKKMQVNAEGRLENSSQTGPVIYPFCEVFSSSGRSEAVWFYNIAPSTSWFTWLSIWAGDVKDTRAEILNEAESNLIMTHALLLLAVATDFSSKLPPCLLSAPRTSGLPISSQMCLLAWAVNPSIRLSLHPFNRQIVLVHKVHVLCCHFYLMCFHFYMISVAFVSLSIHFYDHLSSLRCCYSLIRVHLW